MQQVIANVVGVSVYDPLPKFLCLRLTAPSLAPSIKPGQFVLVDTVTDYVRRPFFPIALRDDGFGLLLPPDSSLRRMSPGDELDCLGPLGKGFPLPPFTPNLLLVAQPSGFGASARQHGVTFLLSCIDQALAEGRNVVLIQEAPRGANLFPTTGLPPGVEVRLATGDGSGGQAGGALDLLPELAQWADQVYAVGEVEWYARLVDVLRDHRLQVKQGLVWGLIAPEVFPCGMGVCGGCTVETRRGYQQPCVEGPVFDLTKV